MPFNPSMQRTLFFSSADAEFKKQKNSSLKRERYRRKREKGREKGEKDGQTESKKVKAV